MCSPEMRTHEWWSLAGGGSGRGDGVDSLRLRGDIRGQVRQLGGLSVPDLSTGTAAECVWTSRSVSDAGGAGAVEGKTCRQDRCPSAEWRCAVLIVASPLTRGNAWFGEASWAQMILASESPTSVAECPPVPIEAGVRQSSPPKSCFQSKFKPIFHYDRGCQSKLKLRNEPTKKTILNLILEMIKKQLFADNPDGFPVDMTAYDGEKTFFSAAQR
nr:protein argonaute 2 [Ipomoea batatas]